MANLSSEIRAEDRDNLHHMLGVGAHIPKRRWGFRNYQNTPQCSAYNHTVV